VAEKAGRTAEALTWMKEIVAYFPEPVFKSRAEERIRVLEKNLQPPKEKRT
jgi:outer membrane protein assembly factor BamD (BamD/ComL family)